MSQNSLIVNRYAKAGFAICKNNNLGIDFIKNLQSFSNNIENSLNEISNPTISKECLKNITSDVAAKLKIEKNAQNFLITIAEARRLSILKKISAEIEKLIKKDNNILPVEIISAQKLSKKQMAEIKDILEKKYQNQKIEINELIQEDIMGGIIIKIESLMIDSSVKNQLSNIYNQCKLAIT